MRVPKRFSLSTMLLLMLVVASVFGYLQWRRQWIVAEVSSLRELGAATKVNLGSNDDGMISLPALKVTDGLLPKVIAVKGARIHDQIFWNSFKPGTVPVCFEKKSNGTYRLSSDAEEFGLEEFRARLRSLQSRLNYLGFSTVHYWEYEYKEDSTYRRVYEDIALIGEGK